MMSENIPRTNTPRSWRLGIELQGGIKPASWIQVSGNLTSVRIRFSNYTAYEDDYDNGGQMSTVYHKTDMALSPEIDSVLRTSVFIRCPYWKSVCLQNIVGSAYLDNTQKAIKKFRIIMCNNCGLFILPELNTPGESISLFI